MRRSAGGDIEFTGCGLRPCNNVGHRLRVEFLARYEDVRRLRDQRDWLKVCRGIVCDVLVEQRIDDVRTGRAQNDGVAVRYRAGDRRRADRAVSSALVFDDDGLAQQRSHALCQHARDQVRRSAGVKGDDHGNRARWPGGLRSQRCRAGKQDCRGLENPRQHFLASCRFLFSSTGYRTFRRNTRSPLTGAAQRVRHQSFTGQFRSIPDRCVGPPGQARPCSWSCR